jgi:hypothetical protein
VIRITTILRLAGIAFAGLLYVWVAAVRSLPRVRRRKALRRRKPHRS